MAEARERRIVSAEEALLRRRRDMEGEHTARMSEAEAAVRRLQVECGHQLEIERDRWVGRNPSTAETTIFKDTSVLRW